MKALMAVVLASSVFLSPVYAVDFLLQGEMGLLMPQKEVGDYYQPSFAYGGALQVSSPAREGLGWVSGPSCSTAACGQRPRSQDSRTASP